MLLVFIITLAVSFVAVRIGAIAFQLTGLEWSLAKFQSLSCFTGTGFTTKEAELITGHPQRRKIASVLMVLGNAGLVTLILTGASTLLNQANIISILSKSLLGSWIGPQFALFVNLIILIAAVVVVYKIFTNVKVTSKLTRYLRRKIIDRGKVPRVSFEELTVATGGYGVTRLGVNENCPVLDMTLTEANLRKMDINILAIVRGQITIPNPKADARIKLHDELICFGKLGDIRDKLCPPEQIEEVRKAQAEPDEAN